MSQAFDGAPATDLLAALDPEQRQVAEALRGPVRVLAGAGTGKTRAITHRIAYGVATGVYAPPEVLAVTFTTRAAGEMRGRLRVLGAGAVQARTFHSAALRQLRYFWPHVHGGELPTLIESKIGLLVTAARRQRLNTDQALLRDLASEVEWAKVSNVHPDDYARLADARGRSVAGHDSETVGRVFAAYEEVKRGQGRMDMEDVLLLTAGMLAEDERVAAQVRRQYKWFVVDEFQDVSPIQSALLDLWLGGRDEICVVGDPAQTIYSFAGANADYLTNFPAKHPGATSIELVRNYRSTPQVVAAANTLLASSTTTSVELRAQRPAGPAVTYTPAPDEVAEAQQIATRIQALRDAGRALAEIAVLFRINAQSEAYEEALADRGIPYVIRGAARFFDRPEVREAVTRLRGAARSGDGGDDLLDLVKATLSGMGWAPDAPTGRGQTRDRWESWQALVSQAEQFAKTPGATPGAFVDDLDRRAAEQHAPVAEGVTLSTFHAAKGLEWDSVFLCGLQDGTLPITYADTPAAIEEERRLLYVGMTRARIDLALSWAQARNPGQAARRKPSRFLDPLLPASARKEPAGAKARKVANCRECGKPLRTGAEKKRGRCGDCPASYDEALFERLREWRKERAGVDEVPAFVIFTDATLQLIAEHKPQSQQALLRISGVGESKLERYGDDVLALVG
ncbi:DNA helicase [Nocardioides szechwanensis]|uniref:DNA 3'-5' helicase n=1 Tax=Nocardioides szechwanensis TaxID=1005944 RepID=A0A1H0JDW0_9ACTN|nr:ATP-dependent DNA helicase UvrD2 [Nocardioides szechwanensis]GEP35089.1 DNA helicase [Nocardioides szechwanensis]SDO41561.1 ATP-dependent DNA helicase, Rep family [Nocardioides szechwanensis]